MWLIEPQYIQTRALSLFVGSHGLDVGIPSSRLALPLSIAIGVQTHDVTFADGMGGGQKGNCFAEFWG